MAPSKTIKIFLASSDELKNDRNAFGNLVRRLDKIYEKRGFRIELFEWEDADAAFNNRPKQDEYEDEVRASDLFLALFHKKGGKFTISEFDVASEEFRRTGIKPKTYVYCRELRKGEEESAELKEFKLRLFNELGHYWCNYNNEDSLQLHFVMQLQLVENKRLDELKVEDGEVTLDGTTVARMDNLRFAADNPDYQRMRQRLMELPALIEKASQRKDKYPDDEDLRNEYQKLLNERNNLQDVFKQQQEFLFDTAKRIAQLHGEQITDRMRRAIEAFDRGDVHEANIILDEAQRDAAQNLTDYRKSKALTEQRRQNVIHSIEELLLNTSTMMADASIAIKERIEKTKSLYAQADEMAAEVDYDKEKYSDLLFDYTQFLYEYGLYRDSEAVLFRQIPLAEELYGTEHEETANSYNNIGVVYEAQGDYPDALKYHFKALEIDEKVLGKNHPGTATDYNNIGLVYDVQGDYPNALEYYFKALEIREKILGTDHPDTATSYNNIGGVYHHQGNYSKALEYNFKALEIEEKVLGIDHSSTATSYNNIGTVYDDQGDYPKALEYFFKVLKIFEKVLGTDHPSTATSYNNIGGVYHNQGNYSKALEYYFKALKILKKVLGPDHPSIATSYNNIGNMYWNQGDYPKALEYFLQALEIYEKVLGKEHPDIAQSYNNIGLVYWKQGDYSNALKYHFKALKIREKVLGKGHPDTAQSYNNIGAVYDDQGDYPKALEYCFKVLKIFEKVLGTDHPSTATSYNNIGVLYYETHEYDKALKYLSKALKICKTKLGPNHPNTQTVQRWINKVQAAMGKGQAKRSFFQRFKSLFNK